MSSKERAKKYFVKESLSPENFSIGHLSDETAKLYGRDLFLIGHVEESEILSDNDVSKYTAIVNKISGEAFGVFFDLPIETEIPTSTDGGRRKQATQISY